jgi:uracil-DNA glycosylase
MNHVVLASETDWAGWRQATRSLVLAGVEPTDVRWSVGGKPHPLPEGTGSFNIPRALVGMASIAIQAREPERFALLYSLVWRAQSGEKVLEQTDDSDLRLAQRMDFAVRAEAHRMRTLMRFMRVQDPDGERLLGWYAPAHFVLEANAQLIVHRFADDRLSIVTPDGSAHWDGSALRFATGLTAPADDATLAAWWDAHQAAVLADAHEGTSVPQAEALHESPRAPSLPPLGPVVLDLHADPDITHAWREAGDCRRCHLWEPSTQTVFGEGPAGAAAMFIGEQPGDQEDVIGRPFVGPAGQLLDRAMEEAGIDRRTIYITNAVKHFKFTPRGRRRIHQPPDAAEINVCRFWLDVERVRLRPKLLVLMGASGARAVLGRPVTVTRERGRAFKLPDGQLAFVTVHPSYLLRIPDEASKTREYAAFVRDLTAVRDIMAADA